MKRTPKAVFFIVSVLIIALTCTSFFGIHKFYGDRMDTIIKGASEIRFGVDIQGGVDATFGPVDDKLEPTDAEMDSIRGVIEERMVLEGITDYEIYTDYVSDRVIVRFPWGADKAGQDPQKAITELGETAQLYFYYGDDTDSTTGKPKGELVLTGDDVASATAGAQSLSETSTETEPVVQLKLTAAGTKKFATATEKAYKNKECISIWLDYGGETGMQMISAPTVEAVINNGEAVISGSFTTIEDAETLANQITSGAMPFAVEAKSTGTVAASLGEKALQGMVLAGIIGFVLIAVYLVLMYRLPGVIAIIALLGQVGGSIAAVSGYFSVVQGFTLTLPGIAGVIMSMGMGVDANVITAERIREEIRRGKTIDGSIEAGSRNSISAIVDGNVTTAIVAVVLMGVFGPSDGLWAIILSPVLSWFPASTTGAVYSFGYTLLVGIIFNFIMSVFASRLMLKSIVRFKALRKPWLLGGERV